MRNHYWTLIVIIGALGCSLAAQTADPAAATSVGEREFLEHCAVCHPQGGNIINPEKTLHEKVLKANGIVKPADIVAKMRNPGPSMTQFDTKTIPDNTATEIAEYILKTFK